MHLENEVLLPGHRLQIGIQAVDDEKRRPVLLDGGSGSIGELSRRQLGWVHLLDLERTALNVGSYVHAERGAAGQQRSKPLIEQVVSGSLAAFERSHHAPHGGSGFTDTGRAAEQGIGARYKSASKQRI